MLNHRDTSSVVYLRSQGVSANYHKTPSAEEGPPQVDHSWVCVPGLSTCLTGPDGVTPLQPQPMARLLGGVGQLFDGLSVNLSPDSNLPKELC